MWYNIDINKFAQHLLPPVLRKKRLFAFLKVLVYPFFLLIERFKQYREESIRKMQINGQVIFIEKILNDTYFLRNREIYITDIEERQQYMNTREEGDALISLSMRDEGAEPVYFQMRGEGNIDGNYIVNVPSFLEAHIEEIKRICTMYKPSGRKFVINIYSYE